MMVCGSCTGLKSDSDDGADFVRRWKLNRGKLSGRVNLGRLLRSFDLSEMASINHESDAGETRITIPRRCDRLAGLIDRRPLP